MTAKRRVVWWLICLPVALAILFAVAFQYRIFLGNSLQLVSSLPPLQAVDKKSRALIITPHCDDESIAAGGLMNLSHRTGADVRVVVITNGDGFRVAVEREYHKLRVTPPDYVRYAEKRQEETRKAVRLLGLRPSDVVFLSYPDRGLLPMWTTNWSPSNPYRSFYTKATSSPYPDSYRRNAIYCGQYVFEDLRSIIAKYKPTDIYIPHPSDDHLDHTTAYSFSMAALTDLQKTDPRTFGGVRVQTYLVHRGEWPTPMGRRFNEPLRPPAAMAHLDTTWYALPLEDNVVSLKFDAIRAHVTQMKILGWFISSFARKNELFGTVDIQTIRVKPARVISIDGSTNDWTGIKPIGLDPTGDKLLRSVEKGGDVKAIYVYADDTNVYIRADFARTLSRGVTYKIGLRGFHDTRMGFSTDWWTCAIKPPNTCAPSNVYFAWKGSVLEVAAPRSIVGTDGRLFVNVDTSAMRMKVDKTGYRLCRIQGLTTAAR